ncbi:hypothetical protein [Azospirillum sp. TSH64]|uniref:hypothetical protein n=1 Tax=Azospirillum sp. TSH64 TaxID=652740 RepID=UPI000D617E6E|nr:hypothetical protein [Azospirillum sp. TSH64]PWC81240.1 hypothetical protein TSH64_00920 [Azospirillum sp. TSH64]
MTIDLSSILAIIAVCLTIVGGIWGGFHFLFKRIDDGDDTLRNKLSEDVGELHRRIDETRGEYVRRDDYARDMAQLHTDVSGLREDIRAQGISITARLDQLILSRAMQHGGGNV